MVAKIDRRIYGISTLEAVLFRGFVSEYKNRIVRRVIKQEIKPKKLFFIIKNKGIKLWLAR